MKFEDCEKLEAKLRENYINFTPEQRISVISQRLENTDSRPNFLVTLVSAVEALARSILLDLATSDGKQKNDTYKRIKRKRARYLIESICAHESVNSDTTGVFGKEHFENLKCAEKYRDLLVHEATYLAQGISTELIDSTQKIYSTLELIAKKEWCEQDRVSNA